jgi:hypothetical protein
MKNLSPIILLFVLTLNVKSQNYFPTIYVETLDDTYSNPKYDNAIITFDKDIIKFDWYVSNGNWLNVDFTIDTILTNFDNIILVSFFDDKVDSIVIDERDYQSTLFLLHNTDYGTVALEVINKPYKKKLKNLSFILYSDYNEEVDDFTSMTFYHLQYEKFTLKRKFPSKKYLKN